MIREKKELIHGLRDVHHLIQVLIGHVLSQIHAE